MVLELAVWGFLQKFTQIGFGNGNGQGMSLDLKIIWVHVPRLPVPHPDRDRWEHFILGPTSPIGG